MTDYTTIKINAAARQRLKLLAVRNNITMMQLIDRLIEREEARLHQQETQTMNSKQKYSIKVNGDVLYHDLSENEAISIAQREAEAGNEVFVTWFRKTDGQHGYLNSDGNHEITGTAW